MPGLLLSALGVVCASCDRFNPPGTRECGDCGRALVDEPRAESAPPGMRPSSRRTPVVPTAAAPPAPEPRIHTPDRRAAIPAPLPTVSPRPQPTPAPSKFALHIVAGKHAGQRFRLAGSGCMVGRNRGAILLAEDPFVSPHHATFVLRDGKLFVRDEASLSGVFVSILGGEAINAGTFFAAGARLFRFVGALPTPAPPQSGRPGTYGAPLAPGQAVYGVEEILVGGRAGRAIVAAGPVITIGQQRCDLAYPHDRTLASRHCELSPNGPGATLRDVSGGIGTFVRIAHGVERPLGPGDRVRIGAHLLQVEVAA